MRDLQDLREGFQSFDDSTNRQAVVVVTKLVRPACDCCPTRKTVFGVFDDVSDLETRLATVGEREQSRLSANFQTVSGT